MNALKNLVESTLMSADQMRGHMAKVRIAISSSLVGWVAKFISGGGFHALLDIFRKV